MKRPASVLTVNGMKSIGWLFVLPLLLELPCRVQADGPEDNNPRTVRRIPKEGVLVPEEIEQQLNRKLRLLQEKIEHARLLPSVSRSGLLPDVMIFERAVRCALQYNEFFHERELDRAQNLLDEGLRRADQLITGHPDWIRKRGLVVRGFISRIDQTVQPYGLWIDRSVSIDHDIPARCDIWFHGRGETLSEVNFLWDRMNNPGRYTPHGTIVLHPYGRYSNAFKFAGETDVLEALEDVRRRYLIDENRISVRGFSMGGAACWQFATHYPDRWFAANPGAGFSETPRFLKEFQKETLNPKSWERALWNLYDCDRYAVNLTHCPTIAYSGELDRQKQAADVMEEALLQHGIRLRHVIGAGMGHTIDDHSRQVIESAMSSLAEKGRNTAPKEIRFQTHTLKYNRLHWLTVDGLLEHWKPASVRAVLGRPSPQPDGEDGFVVDLHVSNVSAVSLDVPAGTLLPGNPDGDPWIRSPQQSVPPRVRLFCQDDYVEGANDGVTVMPVNGPYSDGSLTFQAHRNANGQWVTGSRSADLIKRHGLQGPIDDAFMDSFVFVRPTGQSSHEAVAEWVDSELNRAVEHWRRHFRGDVQIVDDTQLSEDQIASSNIILWGDSESNHVISRVLADLPIEWNPSTLSVCGQDYAAGNHVPILIHPNPLNPDRYVVLNSSFTFREYAYLNNARQVPMLPDWAVVNIDTSPGTVWPGDVLTAGFFDEWWRFRETDP